MDAHSDPQAYADSVAGLIHDDYLMADGFSPKPDADADPLDYRFGAPHMMVLDKLPAVTTARTSQAAYESLMVHGSSAWEGIVGNELSQNTRYWGALQSPQSIPRRQGGEVCPDWIFFPSGCDHRRCYPPPDVGFRSRRFEENQDWIRARACAVAFLAHRRRGIYSLPTEILEMIANHFPIPDPLAGFANRDRLLQAWNRHTAFRILAATCIHLRVIFYRRSWTTIAVTATTLPRIVTFLKGVGVQVQVCLIGKLVTRLSNCHLEVLRDCLQALPSLHTLWIMDDPDTGTGVIKTAFKHKPDFPSIKSATMPVCACPILARLPNVEELVCYHSYRNRTPFKSILNSLRRPHAKEESGEVEPVLKSLSVVNAFSEQGFTEALVEKFPRLRKVCVPDPFSMEVAKALRGLKEIVELEIFTNRGIPWQHQGQSYSPEPIKSLGIKILQASECHKDCVCKYECGCSETGDCWKCNPPKRFLRIQTPPNDFGVVSRFSEIQVSPQRVLSTK